MKSGLESVSSPIRTSLAQFLHPVRERTHSPGCEPAIMQRQNGYYLRLSVTPRCGLRCRYCRTGIDSDTFEPPLTSKNLALLLQAATEVFPIRKLRFTGGEPLLRSDIAELIATARRMLPDAELCLTTNGLRLADQVQSMRNAGLDRVNVSLDTLEEATFRNLTGGRGVERVVAGMEAARRAGLLPLKINTVLMRTVNFQSMLELIRLALYHGALIRFLELMPIGEGHAIHSAEHVPMAEALEVLKQHARYVGEGGQKGTTKLHRFVLDGQEFDIGFISPVSHPFCDTCDRLRIDAHLRLFYCLRWGDGFDLLRPLHIGDLGRVRELFSQAVAKKEPPGTNWPSFHMNAMGG